MTLIVRLLACVALCALLERVGVRAQTIAELEADSICIPAMETVTLYDLVKTQPNLLQDDELCYNIYFNR